MLCERSGADLWPVWSARMLPFTGGAENSCCSMAFGGSESQSQQMVHRSIYNEIQGKSKQKSVIGGCLMIWDSITWRDSRWDDVWSWVGNMLVEANLFLSIYRTVLRKTYMEPNNCFERLQASWNYSKWCIIHDDPDFGDFLEPNFPSFSAGGSGSN